MEEAQGWNPTEPPRGQEDPAERFHKGWWRNRIPEKRPNPIFDPEGLAWDPDTRPARSGEGPPVAVNTLLKHAEDCSFEVSGDLQKISGL